MCLNDTNGYIIILDSANGAIEPVDDLHWLKFCFVGIFTCSSHSFTFLEILGNVKVADCASKRHYVAKSTAHEPADDSSRWW